MRCRKGKTQRQSKMEKIMQRMMRKDDRGISKRLGKQTNNNNKTPNSYVYLKHTNTKSKYQRTRTVQIYDLILDI